MRSLFPLLFSLLTPTLATQCYSGGFILIARGSEEPQGQSILEPIASAISSAIPNSGSNEVVYPALLSFWNSAPTGVINAQQQMQDYYAACPDGKMVLLGYSQGSFVMATALAGGNYSGQSFAPVASDIGENIAAIVLFGDQSHVPGQGLMATGTNCVTPCNTTSPLQLTGSYASTMQGYSDRLEEWCDDQDPICCSTGTNIQAHLSYWSQNTTDSVVHLINKFVKQLFVHGIFRGFVYGSFDDGLFDCIGDFFCGTINSNKLCDRLERCCFVVRVGAKVCNSIDFSISYRNDKRQRPDQSLCSGIDLDNVLSISLYIMCSGEFWPTCLKK